MLLLAGTSLAALTILLYAPLLWGWVDQCLKDPSFSHALAVPLVAAYLVYLELARKNRAMVWTAVRFDRSGYFVLLLGCGLLLIGERAAITFVARLSLLIVIAGTGLVLFGRGATRVMAFPYGFLFLALPLPALVYLPLAFRLQLLSSGVAAEALDLFGIPALREGNVIMLPNVSLQVVEACSGVHSLFALLTISVLAGYLFVKSYAARLFVAISAAPVAIGLNAVRVTLLGALSYFFGPDSAEGFAHFSTGMVLFALGCIAILLVAYRFAGSGPSTSDPPAAAPLAPRSEAQPTRPMVAFHTVLIGAILLGTFAVGDLGAWSDRPQPILEPWTKFPLDIADWHGREMPLTQKELDVLGTDSVLMREYNQSGDSIPVDLYVAFFPSQHEGTTMHSPLHCIPGAGWEIQKRTILPVYLNSDGWTIKANEVVFRKASRQTMVLFWYMEQGEPETNELSGALKTLWSSAIDRRTDGCLIRFSSPVIASEEGALSRELSLLHQTLPILVERFLPASSSPHRSFIAWTGL